MIKAKIQVLTSLCVLAFATSGYAAEVWATLSDYSTTSAINDAGSPIYGQKGTGGDASIKVDEDILFQTIVPDNYTVAFDFVGTSGGQWITIDRNNSGDKFANKAFKQVFTNSGNANGFLVFQSGYVLGQTTGSDGYELDSSAIKGKTITKSTFSILSGATMKAGTLEARAAFSNAGTYTVNSMNILYNSTTTNSGTMNATTISVERGSTFTNSGTLRNIDGTQFTISGDGSSSNSGDISVGSFSISGGSFSNTGTITGTGLKIESTFTHNGGSTTINGNVDIYEYGTLEHTSGQITVNNGTTTVYGNLTLSANLKTTWFTLQGGSLTINSGGSISTGSQNLAVRANSSLTLNTDASFGGLYMYDNSVLSVYTNGNALTFNSGIGATHNGTMDFYFDNATQWEDNAIRFVTNDKNVIEAVLGNIFVGAGSYAIADLIEAGKLELVQKDGSFYLNAVPEPAEWAAIFGAIALGFVAYRRRK